MNHLLIGNADKTERLLELSEPGFLLIDDGEIAETFLQIFPRAKLFDISKHSFNPLRGVTYLKACNFVASLMAAFPAGQATLTKEGVPNVFFEAALNDPQPLDRLLTKKSKDPSYLSAQRMIDRLLFSPVLTQVLCNPTNFSFKGSVVAKINRAELGDFDAFILASLLIGQFKGHIIVPDFGFYGRDIHTTLVRENRLTAGLNSLSECSQTLQQVLLGIKAKSVSRTSLEDAERLVHYFPEAHGKPRNIVELGEGQWFSS